MNIFHRQKFKSLGILLLLLCSTELRSAETFDESLCRPAKTNIITDNSFSKDGQTHLQADVAEITKDNLSRFAGNVVIQQANKRIESDQAEYHQQTEQLHAQGHVKFLADSILINSEKADVNLKTDQATLTAAQYQSLTNRARGVADVIETSQPNVIVLSNATYTTCDPGQVDWELRANDITLDNNSHQGSASHVVLRFKDVPFLYLPYIRFPLGDKRMSGLLFPTLGDSDKHGFELQVPYYWNIDPQYDATFTPWYMSKRGTMLHTEFRYLSQNNEGSIESDYLDDDKLANSKRERWHWQHKSGPGLGWRSEADVNYIADNQHLVDFSTGLESNTTNLIRTGTLGYDAEQWQLNIKAEEHQVISGAEPYKRLPQISFNSRFAEIENSLNHEFTSEFVRFAHNQTQVIGDRLDMQYKLAWPWVDVAGFVKPELAVRHTRYQLDQTTGDTEPSRSLPVFSLNSGLFFERDTHFFEIPYIQTLEPQLFYVYVPYRDQADIPIFDTTAYAFNFNQPFADYRFNGIDRIGDDNRLTAALATRFLRAENGAEVFMARVGQVHYFDDRRVQLPGVATDTANKSSYIAEIKTKPASSLSISAQMEWDPETEKTVISSNNFSYTSSGFSLNLAQRYQQDTLDTREINLKWKISPTWSILAKSLYDLKADHNLETQIGLDYDSCCWGLRITADEYYSSATLENEKVVYVSLVFKGLGYLGRSR